jgi:decaprenyl-phosphate phosphoribosyltransferase
MIAYLRIARFDHWGKNAFMLLGFLLAWFLRPVTVSPELGWTLALAFLLTGLVASSNYVINEILDAPRDRHHPEKCHRPIPSGQVKLPLAYAEWILLGALGLAGAWFVNKGFFLSALALWIMGCVYNIPPLRTKELPWLDVLSESVNNPLRLFLGWFVLIPDEIPPLSLIVSYWMFGAFFMAIKRFAEYRHIRDPKVAAAYRNSFRWYNEERLLVSFFFYALTGAFFGGVFIVRYRLELVLFLPVAAAFITYYLKIGLWPDSPVQHPEKLFKRKRFMITTLGCLLLFILLMTRNIPQLYTWFNVDPPTSSPLWTW